MTTTWGDVKAWTELDREIKELEPLVELWALMNERGESLADADERAVTEARVNDRESERWRKAVMDAGLRYQKICDVTVEWVDATLLVVWTRLVDSLATEVAEKVVGVGSDGFLYKFRTPQPVQRFLEVNDEWCWDGVSRYYNFRRGLVSTRGVDVDMNLGLVRDTYLEGLESPDLADQVTLELTAFFRPAIWYPHLIMMRAWKTKAAVSAFIRYEAFYGRKLLDFVAAKAAERGCEFLVGSPRFVCAKLYTRHAYEGDDGITDERGCDEVRMWELRRV